MSDQDIDWHGVGYQCFFKPGTVKKATCGICKSEMKVERSVLAATCLAEALAGRKHLTDYFYCPLLSEDWHERIYDIKMDVYKEELRRRDPVSLEKKRKSIKKEIIKLLKKHKPR